MQQQTQDDIKRCALSSFGQTDGRDEILNLFRPPLHLDDRESAC